jgi:hypothetical protein
MTRGRPVTKGVADAIRLAGARGYVMKFYPGPESMCDFLIRTPVHVIFVRVKRFLRILAPPAEIESEHRDLIQLLRSFPVSDSILRELWVYSKHGTYRYFRVTDTGIMEIDRAGLAIPNAGGAQLPAAGAAASGGNDTISSP